MFYILCCQPFFIPMYQLVQTFLVLGVLQNCPCLNCPLVYSANDDSQTPDCRSLLSAQTPNSLTSYQALMDFGFTFGTIGTTRKQSFGLLSIFRAKKQSFNFWEHTKHLHLRMGLLIVWFITWPGRPIWHLMSIRKSNCTQRTRAYLMTLERR